MRWKCSTSLLLLALVAGAPSSPSFGWQKEQQGGSAEEVHAAMSSHEWRLVEHERGASKRVRKLLQIGASRLRRAQALTAQGTYQEATQQIKQYTAIISYASAFIESLPEKQRKKRRNAYKEFDVRIRKQLPVLEKIKRDFPIGIQEIGDALYTAKRLRIIALNGFSGTEIIKVPEERPY